MTTLPKIDRRIQRTRQLLRDALMAAIIDKGYEDVSIQDITDRANVSRTTFYLHYKDKEELLFTSMEEVYDELVRQAPPFDPKHIGETVDATEFEHVKQYAAFYRVMFSKRGSAGFILRVQDYLAGVMLRHLVEPLRAVGITPRLPIGLIAYSMAGSEIGLMKWWLDNGLTYTTQEMAHMTAELCLQGAWWSLGYDNPPQTVRPDANLKNV